MWALRRSSIRLRSQGLNDFVASRAACVKLMPTTCVDCEAALSESHQMTYGRFISMGRSFNHTGHASMNFTVSRRELSSQADASNTKEDEDDGDDETEDQLSEVEEVDEDGTASETDILDGDDDVGKSLDELELSDTESQPTNKKSSKKRGQQELFKAIADAPGLSVGSALDKWVEKGNEISRQEFTLALSNLRKRKMYGRALQLFLWVEANKKLEFNEVDYAARLDLIAKLSGLHKAEKYIEHVPNSFRGELLYRTLLANCTAQNQVKKTEEVFNKMKDSGLPLSAFAYNQLLLIYKRTDKKKIADVLLMMEKENIKPSSFTYKILIDAKGASNDTDGMEQIVETMKAEGTEPDLQTLATLARHYALAKLDEKAEAILKEIEGEDLKENMWVCPTLMRLYALLGKADEVERIWKLCGSSPRVEDCLAAVEAWGRLKKIEEAEAIFEMMSKKWKLSAKNYAVLLQIYTRNQMLNKGKELIIRMGNSGCKIGPMTWDALVKLYVEAGEVEKADSILQKAIQTNHMKPMFSTFMTILEQYAKRGDVHSSEKIFHRMRQAGYTSRISMFQFLIQAYVKAKVPAYGMRERLKADNLFPNKFLADQLVRVDAFKKTPVSELLD